MYSPTAVTSHWLLAILIACAPVAAHGACSLASSSVAFGAYDAVSATAATFNGTVTVTCTALSGLGSYSIKLSTGGGTSYAGRQMTSGSLLLPYQLYSEATRTSIWGDGTGGTVVINGSNGIPVTGGTTVFQIYGRIAARLVTTPASYLDSITATLTY